MRQAWLATVLLVGCGGAPTPAAAPRVAAPTCASTAEHMVDFVASQQDPRPPDDAMNPLIALIRTRCEEDRWTAEARQCLREMRSKQDADTCGTLLTEAQQAALVHDQQEKFGVLGDPTATRDRSGDAPAGDGAAEGAGQVEADTDQEGGPAGRQAPAEKAPAEKARKMSTSPPAPPPAPRKRSRAPAKTADPCDGGE